VSYTTEDGTAGAADSQPATGTVTLPAGATEATLSIALRDDLLDEDDEAFRLRLSAPVLVQLGTAEALGTIVDDDTARLSIEGVTVEEGDSGTPKPSSACVRRTPPTGS